MDPHVQVTLWLTVLSAGEMVTVCALPRVAFPQEKVEAGATLDVYVNLMDMVTGQDEAVVPENMSATHSVR